MWKVLVVEPARVCILDWVSTLSNTIGIIDKVTPPGLLSMVIEPYLSSCLPDIMMIPISISYERTLEEFLFARELLGIPKPKESTSVNSTFMLGSLFIPTLRFLLQALFRARSILSENYGSIFVHIGKPISLHGVCQQLGVSRIPHSLLPK